MPLVPLVTAFALGIFVTSLLWDVLGPRCDLPVLSLFHAYPSLAPGLALLPIALLGLAYLWRKRKPLLRGVVLFYVLLGALLYLARPFTPCLPADHVARIADALGDGDTVVVTGVITAWPETRPHSARYRLHVQEIRWRGERKQVRGTVLVRAARYPAYRYGDRVRVVGRLSRPPVFDDFDYRRYLARQGIHAVLAAERIVPLDAGHGSRFWHVLYGLRARGAETIDATLPEPYAALAKGILLGIESDIPRDLYADFNATGTSHIIVISGFNIAIVAGLFLALLGPLLGKRRAAVVAIVGIGLYVLLVGADAAVVRAGLMGGIFAASQVLRRQTHALNSLFASALIMLSLNPLTLWDVGFQLSFLATLGLIVILPGIQRPFRATLARILPEAWHGPTFDLLNDALVVTAAAQTTTTPLIVATFGRVSLISLLTNALILPVQPAIMVGAGVSTLVGMLWLPLGRVMALVPLLPLAWTVAAVRLTADWPGAGMAAPPGLRPLAALYYAGLAIVVVAYHRRLFGLRPFPRPCAAALARLRRLWDMIALSPRRARWLLAVAALIPAAFLVPTTATTFEILPGGHALITTPDGWHLLFPTRGPRPDPPLATLPPLTPPSSTVWVVTHTDAATLAALRLLLQDASPTLVIMPPLCLPAAACPADVAAFLQSLDARGVRRAVVAPEQWAQVGSVAMMYPLSPSDEETVHPVLVRMGDVEVLLPDDLPFEVQTRLVDALPRLRDGKRPLVMVLPLPRTGAWPGADVLAALTPSLLLYPEGTTYPPSSEHALARFPLWRFDPENGVRARVGPGTTFTPLSGPR